MAATIVFEDGRYNGRTAREWLPEVVAALVEPANPLKIALFGSVAEGTEGRDSDLDLLLAFHVSTTRWRRCCGCGGPLSTSPVPLDIIPTDPDEIAQHGDDMGSLLGTALRHGRVVHERPA